MDTIGSGRREVAQFCAGTSLVTCAPRQDFATGPRPVHDLSWWKPFLQLCGPDRITGPEDARRLFSNRPAKPTAPEDIIIDHRADDVHVPYDQRSTLFSSMRNRRAAPAYANVPAYHDDPVRPNDADDDLSCGDIPAAYVIAERVTAPVELRFFPNRKARVVDC